MTLFHARLHYNSSSQPSPFVDRQCYHQAVLMIDRVLMSNLLMTTVINIPLFAPVSTPHVLSLCDNISLNNTTLNTIVQEQLLLNECTLSRKTRPILRSTWL